MISKRDYDVFESKLLKDILTGPDEFTQHPSLFEIIFYANESRLMPLLGNSTLPSSIDIMFLECYGERNASTNLMKLIKVDYYWTPKNSGNKKGWLTIAGAAHLANELLRIYDKKWSSYVEMFQLNYDPIHNYLDEWEDESHAENETNDILDSTRTDTLNTTETTNNTRTDNLLSTQTINESESTTNSQTDGIFGFNSSTSSNADKSDGTGSKTTTGTNTNANTGTQGVSGTVADTGTNTRDTDESRNILGTEDKERSGRHSGNIGNITTQKMIKEELDLWRFSFIDNMMRDVAEFISLPVYLSSWKEYIR